MTRVQNERQISETNVDELRENKETNCGLTSLDEIASERRKREQSIYDLDPGESARIEGVAFDYMPCENEMMASE